MGTDMNGVGERSRNPRLFGIGRWVFLLACLAAPGWLGAERPLVVASTTMIADMVGEVGGGAVTVRGLMGPGVDPHSYKASAGDVRLLRRADLILYNGLFLEGRMATVFERMGDHAIAVTDGVPREKLLQPAEFEGHYDPHVWLDPQLWALCVGPVVEGLSRLVPEEEAAFAKRGEHLRKRVLAEHERALRRVDRLPKDRRVLVTSHDAFNYFGRAYGFEVLAIQGISTVTEAGLSDIAAMVDLLKERGVPAVFLETSVSPGAMQRVSRDAGVRIGGELFSDALGVVGDMREGLDGERYDVGTWSGMFRYNLDTILAALGVERASGEEGWADGS